MMNDFLKKTTAGLPNWAWGLVIIAGLGIGYFVVRRQTAPSTDATDTSGASDIPVSSPNRSPFPPDYGQDGHETIIVPLPGYTPAPAQTTPPAPAPTPTPAPAPRDRIKPPPKQIATVRARYSISAVKDYDDKNPGGVPVRSSPGGKEVRKQPYGSTVEVLGTPVTGGSNFGSNTNSGSTAWYPIVGGYISSYDITGVSQEYSSSSYSSSGSTTQQNSYSSTNTNTQ